MAREDQITEHESFGMVQLSRVSGQKTLFGSNVSHQNYITLTISKAHHARSDLHEDLFRGDEEIIQVSMSNVQLADLLINMNVGDGVPCTIERMLINGKYTGIPEGPTTSKAEVYVEEFKQKIKDLNAQMHEALDSAVELEDKATATKAARKELSGKIRMAIQELESNMPFILGMFNEKIEKVVSEAKGEIEAFRTAIITKSGLNALANSQHGKPIAGELSD